MLQFRIEFNWGCEDKIRKDFTKEQRDELRKNVLALQNIEEPKDSSWTNSKTGELISYISFTLPREIIVSEPELNYLKEIGLDLNIKNFKQTYKATKEGKDGTGYHFHLPNLGLLDVRYVTWLEDACTENLQTHLDAGWKIIAVCPPNGARRPDYILGSNQKIV